MLPTHPPTLHRLTGTQAMAAMAREKLKPTLRPTPQRTLTTATGTVTGAATTVTAILATPRLLFMPHQSTLSLSMPPTLPRRFHPPSASRCQ